MQYIKRNGYNVAHKGFVIISHVKHFVNNGFVVCDASLNGRSWNTTDEKSMCLKCKEKIEVKQLKLF